MSRRRKMSREFFLLFTTTRTCEKPKSKVAASREMSVKQDSQIEAGDENTWSQRICSPLKSVEIKIFTTFNQLLYLRSITSRSIYLKK
ncbi:hypothetical protein ACFX2I_023758 [Malus domestica]